MPAAPEEPAGPAPIDLAGVSCHNGHAQAVPVRAMETWMYEVALALSVACFAVVTFYFVRAPAFSFFHPFTFYTGFHGLIFVFRPIVAWIVGYEIIYRDFQFNPSASDKLTVILASNLGYLVFAFFCLRTGSAPMRFAVDRFSREERIRLARLFPWIALLLLPFAGLSLYRLYSDAMAGTVLENVVMDARTGVFTYTSGSGYLDEAQLALASCGAIIAWIFRFRLVAMLPLLAFVVFRAGTGGRGPFVTALVTVGLLFLYEHRRRFVSLRAGIALAAAALLFTQVGADRGRTIRTYVSGGDPVTIQRSGADSYRFLEGMDFANLEFFEYIVYAVPQRSGTYDYFLSNLQLFTEPIPRSLWKDKPVGAPFQRIFLFDYGRPLGMTASLPGMGWYFLGWFGVAIWCGLWGHVLGWTYQKYVQGPQTTFQTIGYMVFLPILVIAYRDGSIVTIFREGLFFFLPVLLWMAAAKLFGVPGARAMRSRALARVRSLRRKRRHQAEGPGDAGPPGRPPRRPRRSGSSLVRRAVPLPVRQE